MISRAMEAEILRLHHAEHWPIGTIARQLMLHHATVRRVLAQAGVPAAQKTTRPLDGGSLRAVHPGDAQRISEVVREPPVHHGARARLSRRPGSLPRHRRALPAAAGCRGVSAAAHLAGEQAQFDWAHFGQSPSARRLGR